MDILLIDIHFVVEWLLFEFLYFRFFSTIVNIIVRTAKILYLVDNFKKAVSW